MWHGNSPIPEGCDPLWSTEQLTAYTRANVARATAGLRAELEALQARYDVLDGEYLAKAGESQGAADELAAAREDAARYRWIVGSGNDVEVGINKRIHDSERFTVSQFYYKSGTEITPFVDAAMQEQK